MESIRGIASFVRVASAGSFSAAARQLGVSTVSVSRNVQRLERELGVRLFHRTTRSLSLTEEGRALFESSRHALAELEAAHASAIEHGGEPAGPVRVTSVAVFARLYVVPLLQQFRGRYPRVQIELLGADRVVDMVEEGFDVGIRSGPVPDTNIVVRKLAEVPRVVCAAPDYLARHGTPMTPDDLLLHDCIRYKSPSTGRSTRWEFKRDGDSVAFDVRGSLTFNDPLAVCAAASAGLGLAQLSTFIATPHIRAGTLLPVLIDHAPAHIPLFLHYPARRLLPLRVRVFIDFLLEKLADHPDLTFDPRAMAAPGHASARAEITA